MESEGVVHHPGLAAPPGSSGTDFQAKKTRHKPGNEDHHEKKLIQWYSNTPALYTRVTLIGNPFRASNSQ